MNPKSIIRKAFHNVLEKINLYNSYAETRFNFHRNKSIKIPKSSKQNLVDLQSIQTQSNSLLIVVPISYVENWFPAEGNFYFEMFQSAKERHPDWRIEVFFCAAHEEWQKSLEGTLIKVNPDIMIISSEIDPDGKSDWTLDIFVHGLIGKWNGTICYLLFDSAFPLHMWRLKRLIRLNSKHFVVSIDQNLSKEEKINCTNIGPIFLPISKVSLKILNDSIQRKIVDENLEPIYISFIGQEYPYRRKILSEIATTFVNIQINPQSLMRNPESYLSYITALHLSKFSINMSRQHVIKKSQLKCRVLEASLFGSYVISDESIYTRLFLEEGDHFCFSEFNAASLNTLKNQIENINFNSNSIRARAEQANTFFF